MMQYASTKVVPVPLSCILTREQDKEKPTLISSSKEYGYTSTRRWRRKRVPS